MKTFLILGAVLFCLFAIYGLMVYRSQNGIEHYPYTLVQSYDGVEIRQYERSLFTTVTIHKEAYDVSSSKGFRILGGYIFGDNERKEKIAMTSPVVMSMSDSMTMMFMVPKEYDRESLPQPNARSISFEEKPPVTMAAIRFRGWANDEKIERYKQKLIEQLQKEGISYTDRFYFYGYNAPYEVFNRRNEVVVELVAQRKS